MSETKENEYTTVRLERGFVEQLQEQMSYNDTYNDFLQSKLGDNNE